MRSDPGPRRGNRRATVRRQTWVQALSFAQDMNARPGFARIPAAALRGLCLTDLRNRY
ncbi:hypothetical protein [Methylobacterium sp. J-088]|nr:hypothetical protein [Methylobacterium sp. J-088]